MRKRGKVNAIKGNTPNSSLNNENIKRIPHIKHLTN